MIQTASNDEVATPLPGLWTPGGAPKIFMVGDCVRDWQQVDEFLRLGLSSGIEVAKDVEELCSLLKRCVEVDICILPLAQVRVLSNYPDVEQLFENTWTALTSSDGASWCVPQCPVRIVAHFKSDAPGSALIPLFTSLLLSRWQQNVRTSAKNSDAKPLTTRSAIAMPSRKTSQVGKELLANRQAIGGQNLGVVKTLMNMRRKIFDRASSEPFLSIILQLAYASDAGEHIDMTALGADLRIPLSTLSRKIDYLVDQGLVVRVQHEEDRRRTFVEPTEFAKEKVRAYVDLITKTP